MVKNLKKLRKAKKISQQQLGDIIGVSQQSVNKYENHSIEPDIYTLSKIAKYFDTSIDYLVGNSDIDHVIEKLSRYDLNDKEIEFMDKFRNLSSEQKDIIIFTMDNFRK